MSGLIARPTSATIAWRSSRTVPSSGSTVTSHACQPLACDVAGGREIGLGRQPTVRLLGERRHLEEPDAPVGPRHGEAPGGVGRRRRRRPRASGRRGVALPPPPSARWRRRRHRPRGRSATRGSRRRGARGPCPRTPPRCSRTGRPASPRRPARTRWRAPCRSPACRRRRSPGRPPWPGLPRTRWACCRRSRRRRPRRTRGARLGAWLAARRAGKPVQSASSSARSRFLRNSPEVTTAPPGVVHGNSPGPTRFRRRSSIRSMPVSRAAASIRLSVR